MDRLRSWRDQGQLWWNTRLRPGRTSKQTGQRRRRTSSRPPHHTAETVSAPVAMTGEASQTASFGTLPHVYLALTPRRPPVLIICPWPLA